MLDPQAITTDQFWDDGYKAIEFVPMDKNYPIVKKIYQYFGSTFNKDNREKTVLEIGCFPGRFLYHFGKLGYTLYGIDQTKYLPKLVDWFHQNNFIIGDFIRGNFFDEAQHGKKYDIVFSSGFIEHFQNFEEVIRLHAFLVKPDGYIYISAPNFSGYFQRLLHSFFDKENLDKHYLPSMDPTIWAHVLREEGFEILESGFIGGFDFWANNPNVHGLRKFLSRTITYLTPWRFFPNRYYWSPEIILIAKKTTLGK